MSGDRHIINGVEELAAHLPEMMGYQLAADDTTFALFSQGVSIATGNIGGDAPLQLLPDHFRQMRPTLPPDCSVAVFGWDTAFRERTEAIARGFYQAGFDVQLLGTIEHGSVTCQPLFDPASRITKMIPTVGKLGVRDQTFETREAAMADGTRSGTLRGVLTPDGAELPALDQAEWTRVNLELMHKGVEVSVEEKSEMIAFLADPVVRDAVAVWIIQDDQCDAFLSLWHEAHPDDQRPLAPVAALMQLVGTGASGKAHAILGCSDPDDALLPWLDQVLTLARTPQDVQDAVRRIDPDTDLCWAEWDQILGKERDLPPTETALATYARTEVAFQEMSQTLDRGIDM
ncbi:hypothetical protein [Tessaracoccus defluvii]|uniref:Uncharacterized protein n=1 Tax=Tessaracoccus defluvii TaxID=1285901 RepID=A0A7H0H7G0_9ACTN|nr:hypothetical protein [Tessaracoccus defluvii]QNP56476.1 hypothetical protein H9L22_03325 [Tessaracoccus defluvii]